MKIADDLGHANRTDAVGLGGLRERDVCRNVARLVAYKLRDAGHVVDILDYPDEDNATDLRKTVAAINAGGYEMSFSLHCDCVESPDAHGAHVAYYSTAGHALALCIADYLCPLMPGRADWVQKRTDLYVLKHTKCVAVLIELGFLSNVEDARKLRGMQEAIASLIARGILAWIGKTEKTKGV